MVSLSWGPERVPADKEFSNRKFIEFTSYIGARFEARPARPQNKLEILGRKNAVICLVAERFIKYADYFAQERGSASRTQDVVFRAKFISKILYGNKKLISFELARGYTLSIGGLPQSQVKQELLAAHEGQVARRALQLLKKTGNPRTVAPSLLQRNTPVSYFKRGLKFGKWEQGFVREVNPHVVSISNKPTHNGLPIRETFDASSAMVFPLAGTRRKELSISAFVLYHWGRRVLKGRPGCIARNPKGCSRRGFSTTANVPVECCGRSSKEQHRLLP